MFGNEKMEDGNGDAPYLKVHQEKVNTNLIMPKVMRISLSLCRIYYLYRLRKMLKHRRKKVSDSKQGVWLSQQLHATIATRLFI